MIFFDPNMVRKPIFEVDINGQPQNQDDQDTPVDYTAGNDDGAEDTGAPADDAPNPNPAAPNQPNQDDTNPTDDPEDYTLPDDSTGNEPPGGGMDNRMNNTPPAATGAEGDGADTTDYTGGGNIGNDMGDGDDQGEGMEGNPDAGRDQGADMNNAGDDMGDGDDNYDDDTSGGNNDDYNQQIQDLDKDIYSDLTEPQMDIRNKELKRNFASLYDMVMDIIDRINDISKDTASVKPLEFVTEKLSILSEQISDYLTYTYGTKSYTENEINYNLFLVAIYQINDVIANSSGVKK